MSTPRKINFASVKSDPRYGTMKMYATVDAKNKVTSWSGAKDMITMEGERVVEVPSPKHMRMPENIAKPYKQIAYAVYDGICCDLPEVERYPMSHKVEIVRDANRILTLAQNSLHEKNVVLVEWLKAHEYDPAFSRDMNRAIREVVQ